MSVGLRATGYLNSVDTDWGLVPGNTKFVETYEPYKVTAENVGPLIIISKGFIDLITEKRYFANVIRFYERDGHRFMSFQADNGSWIWELFDAHWENTSGVEVYIGRWPD